MADFDVQPTALRELAGTLDRAHADLGKVAIYLAKMENFEGGTGYLGGCLDGHQAAYRTLSDWLDKVAGPMVSDTSKAVSESAAYYERTDANSAASLDATYSDFDIPKYKDNNNYVDLESEGSARFADITAPTDHLNEPHDYTAELLGTLAWWDIPSMSSDVCAAIQLVSEVAVWLGWLDKPFNPMQELAEEFVGDWAGARAAADILRNVGRALNDIGLNIQWAAQGTEQVWQGNAGDGATFHLINLATRFDVDNAWRPIDALAQQYVEASEDMVNLRDAAVGVLSAIMDAAISAAAACAVGGGAAATGVGTPFAVGAVFYAGYRISKVVEGIENLLGIVSNLATATSALKAAQGGFASPGPLSLPGMPSRQLNLPR
ncbi:hypothetical protein [Actinophytocola sediminis]